MNMGKRIISLLCLVLAGSVLYMGTTFAAERKECEITQNDSTIKMDENVSNNVSEKDINTVTNIAKSKGKEKISIVSEELLTKEDLVKSKETALFVYDNGKVIGVEINQNILEKVEPQIIKDIIQSDDLESGESINILAYKYPEETKEGLVETESTTETVVQPRGGYVIQNSKATKTGSPYKGDSKYVTSVAKGQTKTLSSAVTFKCSREVTGNYYSLASLTNGFAATVTFKSETEYSSEDMTPGTNCRMFYMREYKQNYSRTQKKVDAKTNEVLGTKKATIKKPEYSVEYSKDVKE